MKANARTTHTPHNHTYCSAASYHGKASAASKSPFTATRRGRRRKKEKPIERAFCALLYYC